MAPQPQPVGATHEATGARLGLGLALLAILVGFILHARAWAFICDDAYISFRYAHNLATYGSLEFNVGLTPPERVEGYSNFLWVLLLAAGARVGLAPERLAPALTVLAAGAGLVLVAALVVALRASFVSSETSSSSVASGAGLSRGPRPLLALAPAALLAASADYAVWSQGGLETSFAAALTLAAMLAWSRGRLRSAALLAAAAGLTRLDSLLPIALFGLAWLLVVGVSRAREHGWRATVRALPWARLLQALALFAVPLLAQLLWRRAYYGAWLPNTWAVKAHGALLRGTWGRLYVETWFDQLGLVYAAPLLVLLRPRHLLLALPAGGVVLYAWSVGGDFMAYSRLLVVATALTAALLAWLLLDGVTWLEGLVRARAPHLLRALPGLLALALALAATAATARRSAARWRLDRGTPAGWIDKRWEGVTAMDRFARERVHVGRWMRDNLPPETWVTVGAAGAMPYASGLRIIDAFGLVDPALVRRPGLEPRHGKHARPGHQIQAPRAYIRERDPDLLCHVGVVNKREPGPRDAFRRGFGRGYTWACVAPGPVADDREPDGVLDLGYYCCLRPRGREVGPFR